MSDLLSSSSASQALKQVAAIDVNNTLGEGVIWDHVSGSVWWTDILGNKIFAYHLAREQLQSWPTPARVTCMGLMENDPRLIVTFDQGFAYFDRETGAVEYLAQPELEKLGNRFNDGGTDRQGRFWSGTMTETQDFENKPGALYRLGGAQGCEQMLTDLMISNGLCFSPDSSVMYHSDSPAQEIHAYDFDSATGAISGRRLFARSDEGCFPDGACVDSEGYLYSAQWGGAKVVRYAPNGDVDAEFKMPVTQPSCVAFGGENLDLMLVTTAKEDLSDAQLAAEPDAGKLLIFQTDFKGLQEPFFNPATLK